MRISIADASMMRRISHRLCGAAFDEVHFTVVTKGRSQDRR
jgi:hypothetical protein